MSNTVCECGYVLNRDVASAFLAETLELALQPLSAIRLYHSHFRDLRPGSMPLSALGDTFCRDCRTSLP